MLWPVGTAPGLRNGRFYLTAHDEKAPCAQWPWPQTGHRRRQPARGGLVGGVNPGCASGLGGGRPRGRARGPALRVNFCAFSHAKTSSVTRATHCDGENRGDVDRLRRSRFRTVVLSACAEGTDAPPGCGTMRKMASRGYQRLPRRILCKQTATSRVPQVMYPYFDAWTVGWCYSRLRSKPLIAPRRAEPPSFRREALHPL